MLFFLLREGEQMWKDHFRYDLTTSEIKVISGRVKFLSQLNEGWNMDYLSKAEDNKTCQQIDPFIFYCKNHDEESLFRVASSEKANSEIITAATVPNCAILIIINVRRSGVIVSVSSAMGGICYKYCEISWQVLQTVGIINLDRMFATI